eukprot:scaffold198271_cov14-Tisochrysis_lutea.AAC.1
MLSSFKSAQQLALKVSYHEDSGDYKQAGSTETISDGDMHRPSKSPCPKKKITCAVQTLPHQVSRRCYPGPRQCV